MKKTSVYNAYAARVRTARVHGIEGPDLTSLLGDVRQVGATRSERFQRCGGGRRIIRKRIGGE